MSRHRTSRAAATADGTSLPRVVMTLLVRDEIDVIDACVAFHFDAGISHLIVTDNGSTDGTRERLDALARRWPMTLLDEPPSDFSQHRWVTRMARMAATTLAADWVLHADADEIFLPVTGPSLPQVLAALAPEVDRLLLTRHDFVDRQPRPRDHAPQQTMTLRKRRSLNMRGLPLPPKIVHRACADCVVEQGNHGVSGSFRSAPEPFDGIEVLHYPIRGLYQFLLKARNGGEGYARNHELPEHAGMHKRRWYRDLCEGRLARVWQREHRVGTLAAAWGRCSGRLIVDQRAHAWFERLGRISAAPAAPLRPRLLCLLWRYPDASMPELEAQLERIEMRFETVFVVLHAPAPVCGPARPRLHLTDIDTLHEVAADFRPTVVTASDANAVAPARAVAMQRGVAFVAFSDCVESAAGAGASEAAA